MSFSSNFIISTTSGSVSSNKFSLIVITFSLFLACLQLTGVTSCLCYSQVECVGGEGGCSSVITQRTQRPLLREGPPLQWECWAISEVKASLEQPQRNRPHEDQIQLQNTQHCLKQDDKMKTFHDINLTFYNVP
jgi:hypothetical protein